MKREALPAGDQIVRYVKPSAIQEDGTPDGSDFRLRSTKPDETGLSVNWLGAFDSSSTVSPESQGSGSNKINTLASELGHQCSKCSGKS